MIYVIDEKTMTITIDNTSSASNFASNLVIWNIPFGFSSNHINKGGYVFYFCDYDRHFHKAKSLVEIP